MHTRPHRVFSPRLIAILVTSIPGILQRPTSAADDTRPTIVVRDESRGCFHNDVVATEYQRADDGRFVGAARTLEAAWVNELRQLLLTSSLGEECVLPMLGITPQTVGSHRDEVVRSCISVCEDEPVSLPAAFERVFTFESVADAVIGSATMPNVSTTRVVFEVTLPGSPLIVVRSEQMHPLMLPWTIQVDGQAWQSYDIRIPQYLAKLADPKGPNSKTLADTEYWSQRFWNDQFVNAILRSSLGAAYATSLYSALDGFENADAAFAIQAGAEFGCAKRCNFFLHARRPALIESVRWTNPIVDGRLQYDWNDFTRVIESASDAASRFPWLSNWKSASARRSIEIHVVGLTGTAYEYRSDFLIPRWKKAGLSGTPDFELKILNNFSCRAVLFVSSESNRLMAFSYSGHSRDRSADFPDIEGCEFATIDQSGVVVKFPPADD